MMDGKSMSENKSFFSGEEGFDGVPVHRNHCFVREGEDENLARGDDSADLIGLHAVREGEALGGSSFSGSDTDVYSAVPEIEGLSASLIAIADNAHCEPVQVLEFGVAVKVDNSHML